MSVPRPLEEEILAPALRALEHAAVSTEARLDVLEGAASRLGGFALADYRKRFESPRVLTVTQAMNGADQILRSLQRCPIPPPLALASLARPQVSDSQQRVSGAYYTDFRLAQHVASAAAPHLVPGAQVIDPAAGSGGLLVAASLAACGPDRHRQARWLAESVTASDLSTDALRGARLALASLTNDLGAVTTMVGRWRCEDSLVADGFPWGTFDVVLGNPPWERIKLTRHEFFKAHVGPRHYGAAYDQMDAALFATQRLDVARYASLLAERYPLLGAGEPDLYKAFLELFLRLVRPEGCVSVLVPAGLIRSQGSEALRRFLFQDAGDLTLTIIDNRTRFFAIDTRFKFLGLSLTKARAGTSHRNLTVLHLRGTGGGVSEYGRATLSRRTLVAIRPDLTVPEVRSEHEWRLFRRMSAHAVDAGSRTSPWHAEIVREVDMTRDRDSFVRGERAGSLPLVEGRMIHQHRFGSKIYRNGSGRKARWETVPLGRRQLIPQYWYQQDDLRPAVQDRVGALRGGFCDITGQTNERSMLAALVPGGVVCGNKVPTVTFPNDPRESRILLWLAIVNSLAFDWALRRIVTTTVNYFVLLSVPFPSLDPDSLLGRLLVQSTRKLWRMDSGSLEADPWRAAELRATIDLAVHCAYGLDFDDLELILGDFPLLDRGQPTLIGEARSTVTRDLLLTLGIRRFKLPKNCAHLDRLNEARKAGASPYVPSEFVRPEAHGAAEVVDV